MRAARAAGYRTVQHEAEAAAAGAGRSERVRVMRRLRAELRRISRRDFFPSPQRDTARIAVRALAGDDVIDEAAAEARERA